ncbi:hypothetical protein CN091_36200, partial [Sinorhizobium meliloti]
GNGSRQRHSSPSSLASGSSTDETGPPHRIPDSPCGDQVPPFGRSPDRLGLRAFQVHLLSPTTTSLARSSLTNWVRGLACVPTIQKASDPSNVTETCLYEMACGSETGEPPNRSYCA